MDFMKSLGALALGSRLRRLSDRLMRDVTEIYRAEDIAFEPRWFPLFRLLADRGPCPVGQAAEALGQTQPAVSQTARAMQKAGILDSTKDPADQRRSVLSLSARGDSLHQQLRPLWRQLLRALGGVSHDAGTGLLADLSAFEAALDQANLATRTATEAAPRYAVEVIDYAPEHRHHFETLNREWLERYFRVEPIDVEYFQDPLGKIITPGGAIYFAKVGDAIVGTCALLADEQGNFELGKMAVTEGYQGFGVGRKLMDHAIKGARTRGATSLHLVTNSTLKAAIALYRKLGFQTTHEGPHPKYDRGDVCMELPLQSGKKARPRQGKSSLAG